MFFLMDCWVLEVVFCWDVWYSVVVYLSLEVKLVDDLETDLTLAMLDKSDTRLSDLPRIPLYSFLPSKYKQGSIFQYCDNF